MQSNAAQSLTIKRLKTKCFRLIKHRSQLLFCSFSVLIFFNNSSTLSLSCPKCTASDAINKHEPWPYLSLVIICSRCPCPKSSLVQTPINKTFCYVLLIALYIVARECLTRLLFTVSHFGVCACAHVNGVH